MLEVEIGMREEEARRRVQDAAKKAAQEPRLPDNGEIGNGRPSSCNEITATRGVSTKYLSRRIARDRPDILDRMKAGEFRSVRAAALAAGIVKPSFQCPADPVKAHAPAVARRPSMSFAAWSRAPRRKRCSRSW